MACALCRYGVTDSGLPFATLIAFYRLASVFFLLELKPESVTPSVDAECKSLISICFSKIAGAPTGSPQFFGKPIGINGLRTAPLWIQVLGRAGFTGQKNRSDQPVKFIETLH
jgi:hypothetical protein